MDLLYRRSGVCRRFLNGHCAFGDQCRYRHERQNEICRHFLKGLCWFGDRCKFLHVLPPGRSLPESNVPSFQCHFSAASGQPDREVPVPTAEVSQHQRRGLNSSPNQAIGHMATETTDPHLQETKLTTSVLGSEIGAHLPVRNEETEGATAAPQSGEMAQDRHCCKEMICGICMENIFEKPTLGINKFGILPNCSHSFCINCIHKWRKTRDISPVVVKSCPVCRIKSGFFVPHNDWVEGQEKEALIDAFKKKFSDKTCDSFLRRGRCPFKSDCLYRHDKTLFRPIPEDRPETLPSELLGLLIALSLADSDEEDDDDDNYDDSDEDEFNLMNTLAALGFV